MTTIAVLRTHLLGSRFREIGCYDSTIDGLAASSTVANRRTSVSRVTYGTTHSSIVPWFRSTNPFPEYGKLPQTGSKPTMIDLINWSE